MSRSVRKWCEDHGEPYGQSMSDFLDEEVRNAMLPKVLTAPMIKLMLTYPPDSVYCVICGSCGEYGCCGQECTQEPGCLYPWMVPEAEIAWNGG